MKKVLIVTPTSAYKDYCVVDWAKAIGELTYPADVLIIDNTADDGEHCRYLGKLKFGKKNVAIMHAPPMNKEKDLRFTMCRCNNLGLWYALENGYDYYMSIESDVFPPCNDAIERLISHQKEVVGFNYFINKWHFSTSVSGGRFKISNNMVIDYIPKTCLDAFFDCTGEVVPVTGLGLGFLLIDMKVFDKVPCFRVSENQFLTQKKDDMIHADTFFHTDLACVGITPYWDTRYTCEHRNQKWSDVWNMERLKKK